MNLLQATVRRESERWCKRDVRPWWAPKCIDSRGTSLALLAAVRKGGKKRWQNLAGCRSTSVPVIKSRDSSARELVCNRKSEGKRSGGKSKMAWRARFARARWSSSVLLEVVPVPCTGLSSCSKKWTLRYVRPPSRNTASLSRHGSTNHLENVFLSLSLPLRKNRTQFPFPLPPRLEFDPRCREANFPPFPHEFSILLVAALSEVKKSISFSNFSQFSLLLRVSGEQIFRIVLWCAIKTDIIDRMGE